MATKKNSNEGENKKKVVKKLDDKEKKPVKKYKKDKLKEIPFPFIDSYLSFQVLSPLNPPPDGISKKIEEHHQFFDNLGKSAIGLVTDYCKKFGYRDLIEYQDEVEDGIQFASNDIIQNNFRMFRPYTARCEKVAIIPFVYGECLGINETFFVYKELYNKMLSRFIPILRDPEKVKQYQGNGILIAISYSIMELNKPVALFGRYGGSECEFQRIVFNDEEPPYNGNDGIDDESY